MHIPLLILSHRPVQIIRPLHRYFSISTSTMATKSKVQSLPSAAPPLKLYATVKDFRDHRRALLKQSTNVGFIPTMGALHAGHLSLMRRAAHECEAVVVSIFVNPAQFAPTEDLDVYPRTLEADITAIENLNQELEKSDAKGRVESLFVPTVSEMYPSGIPQVEAEQRGAFVTVQPLASKLEGITRPHFFRGVATICTKLFNIVQPDRAYFGQKDVQQSVVLKRMVKDLHMSLEIQVCDTGREKDGLAMSSRNVYLGVKRRKVAPVLYKTLRAVEKAYWAQVDKGAKKVRTSSVLEAGLNVLDGAMGSDGVNWELEYLSLADPVELEELSEIDVREGAILSAALKMLPTSSEEAPVRLIDNIILKAAADAK
ncbi:Pantoate-beta-alanine ligase [Ascodesmis nigricans]|uniref:Pantoate--beta-alanine ligase n=1 Tax=Ascodesmis nigricans TaxID=341454 RepID=A0A4S2N2F9_9PEZI|nr:Pantoate-beta-alanine ligase [Ascodesmis nigricans]